MRTISSKPDELELDYLLPPLHPSSRCSWFYKSSHSMSRHMHVISYEATCTHRYR